MLTPIEMTSGGAGTGVSSDVGMGGAGGGGLGNRVNATMIGTVLASDLAATKASISEQAASSGVGRILNVTV